MPKKKYRTTLFLVMTMFVLLTGLPLHAATNVSKMTKEDLKAKLGSSDILILDVRTGGDWKSSEFKIKGAIRANPGEFDKWSEEYPKNKTIVLYCA